MRRVSSVPSAVRTKGSVSLSGLEPEALRAVRVAYRVYQDLGGLPLVVTSTTSGQHMANSRHYSGQAVDLRIWTLPASRRAEARTILADRLGPEYDVLLEVDHIHVEYDPG